MRQNAYRHRQGRWRTVYYEYYSPTVITTESVVPKKMLVSL
jgi:hypothetical protein